MSVVGSVLRSGPVRELCAICSEPTDDGCLRCGLPLCRDHAPADQECCTACEALWLERAQALKLRAPLSPAKIVLCGVGGLLMTGLVFGGSHLVTAFFGYAVAIVVLLAPFFLVDESDGIPWWLRHHRRRFLSENNRRALPDNTPKQLGGAHGADEQPLL